MRRRIQQIRLDCALVVGKEDGSLGTGIHHAALSRGIRDRLRALTATLATPTGIPFIADRIVTVGVTEGPEEKCRGTGGAAAMHLGRMQTYQGFSTAAQVPLAALLMAASTKASPTAPSSALGNSTGGPGEDEAAERVAICRATSE